MHKVFLPFGYLGSTHSTCFCPTHNHSKTSEIGATHVPAPSALRMACTGSAARTPAAHVFGGGQQ